MNTIERAGWATWLGRKTRRAWPLCLLLSLSTGAQARPLVHISDPREPGLADPVVPAMPAGDASLATDGENWLAVYGSYMRDEIVTTGRLIGPDGQPLSAPFAIAYGSYPKAVVFDGHDYLVLGERDARVGFVRVSSAGTTTGELTLLSYDPKTAPTVNAAVSPEGRTRAIVCASGVCEPFDVIGNEVRRRAALPVSNVNQLVYSNGRWLVLSKGSALYEVTMLQLNDVGAPVEGTLKSLGLDSKLMVAAPAADGFALVRTTWPQIELLTIDSAGGTTVKGKYGADGEFVSPRNFIQRGNGYLLLAEHYDQNQTLDDLLQQFDAELAPSGDPLRLPATNSVDLVEGESEKALMTWSGDALKSRLIDASLPLSSGEAIDVSVAPQGQRQVFVSPAPEGWLALWSVDWRSPWQYALLDDDGALRGKPKAIPNGTVDAMSRGAAGWLAVQDRCAPNSEEPDCSYELTLIPDSGKPRRLPPLQSETDTSEVALHHTFSVTGSEHGWLVVWSAANELHASRFDDAAKVVGDVVLDDEPTGWPAAASAVSADGYRVFWANAVSGKISSATIAATGDVTASPVVVVGERAEVSGLASACSGDDFWLLGEAACREPACLVDSTQPVTRAWFQADLAQPQALATDSFAALVSVGGVALGVISDGHAASFPPIQLGLAEAGAPLEVVRSFEGGASPALAAKNDGRALLAFLHVSTDEGVPVSRIVTSVITVTPEEQGGAAGTAGTAGAAGAETETPGDAGRGGEPSTGVDGGATTGEAGAESSGPGAHDRTSSGCGCHTAPRSGNGLGLLAPLAWLLRRRRQSASAKPPRA